MFSFLLGSSDLLPQSEDVQVRLTDYSKLSIGVSIHGCFCMFYVMN